VVVNNLNNWCLRAETSEGRMHWVQVLQLYKEDTGSTDTTSLRRHGSTMSLQSNTISLTSGGSLKKTQRNLREKVGELETFKDILFGQIETLQRYFDACSEVNKNNAQPLDLGDGLKSIDFKVKWITYWEICAKYTLDILRGNPSRFGPPRPACLPPCSIALKSSPRAMSHGNGNWSVK